MRACVLRGCRVARFFPADAVVIASIDCTWAVVALRPAALVVDGGGVEGTNVMAVDVVVVVVEIPDCCSAAFLLLGFWVGCDDAAAAATGGGGPGRSAPASWPRGRKVVVLVAVVVGTTGRGGRGAMAAKALRGASRGRIGRASACSGGSIAAAGCGSGGGNVDDDG